MRNPDIRTAPAADIQIPVEFQTLYDLAYNLWWTWTPDAQKLFRRIDPLRWHRDHNPVELLINVEPHRWEGLLTDYEFIALYQRVQDAFEHYMEQVDTTWFRRNYSTFDRGPIAYFSTEFGWHECLSIYSGGLGILAGDHCKSASDLGLPFVGVGLMYGRGYFHQTIDADGHQQHHYFSYDFRRLPLLPVITPSGRQIHVQVPFPDREVHLRLWKASVGRVPVILLDSDIRENHPADRAITSVLYIRGREMRLCQEIVLGVGGVRALEALGIHPSVWHMNEGHSALLTLERVGRAIENDGRAFPDAFEEMRRHTVFTTHTPVPAGNESFDIDLMMKYFQPRLEQWGIEPSIFAELGNAKGGYADLFARTGETNGYNGSAGRIDSTSAKGGAAFNLTALAINASRSINGVSKMHGRVANEMWTHLDPNTSSERLIGYVTNGVHVSSWIGPEMSELLVRHLGEDALGNPEATSLAGSIHDIEDEDLWQAHMEQKRRLLHYTRQRVREQFARHGRSPDQLRQVDDLLDEKVLTVGFARRFATYKRASLLFRDHDRLRSMLGADDRPLQLIFAGKAHPADRPGQEMIRDIFECTLSEDFAGRAVFLEDYDIRTARYLVQGVDLWLNTPRRPQEASGTSGMKAAANGVLNASILDGWWWEGYDPIHGWAIGADQEYEDRERQDEEDAASLYRVLGEQVVPCYYDVDESSKLPRAWIERMKHALADLTPRFNTARMVREYVESYYLPASED